MRTRGADHRTRGPHDPTDRRRRLGAGLALLLVAALLPVGAAGGASATTSVQPVGSTVTRTLSYAEEFSGTSIDRAHWGFCYHWRAEDCTNEWNDELQVYRPANVTVSGGAAHLTARRERATGYLADGTAKQFDYTSGFISTQDKVHFHYGYVEFRAKVVKGQGMWPALWLLPQSRTWPPEIDVMEYIGSQPDRVYMTNHLTPGVHNSFAYVGPDFSEGYHTFAIDWRPGSITWYVDGVERARTTTGVPDEPMYLIANLAVGGSWPGAPDATTTFPATFSVDYVRVWDAGRLVAPARTTTAPAPAPAPAPGAPRSLAARPTGGTTVDLTWAAPVANGSGAITDYRVQYRRAGSASWLTFADPVKASPGARVTGLAAGVRYEFRVNATAGRVHGASSATASATTFTVPSAPRSLRLTAGTTSIGATWTAPSSTGGTAVRDYVVQVSRDGTTWTTVPDGVSTTARATITGLRRTTRYSVRVAAVNAVGRGPWTTVTTTTR